MSKAESPADFDPVSISHGGIPRIAYIGVIAVPSSGSSARTPTFLLNKNLAMLDWYESVCKNYIVIEKMLYTR